MPHKHKRKREDDESTFNLPPSSRARTLSVHQKSESIFTSDKDRKENFEQKKQRRKNRNKGAEDDTPKAFARLMAFQKEGRRIPNGLDDGMKKDKKKGKGKGKQQQAQQVEGVQTQQQPAESDTQPEATMNSTLKILPGERLSDFSLRVDQTLPLTSIPKHKTKANTATDAALNIKTPLTKHNKRLARMQADWRTQEAKLRERREEEDDDMAEKREEEGLLWLGVDTNGKGKGGKGKKKRMKELQDEADPWRVLERKRRLQEAEQDRELAKGARSAAVGRARGLNVRDSAQAPPVLKPLKNIFKEKGDGLGARDPRVLERTVMT